MTSKTEQPDDKPATPKTGQPAEDEEVPVHYVGPGLGRCLSDGERCAPGEPVMVSPGLAGRSPSGTPDKDGYDPGGGLLAQDVWTDDKKAAAARRKAHADYLASLKATDNGDDDGE